MPPVTTALDGLMGRALVEQVPFSVLFELTNRCNEDCRHCYVDLGDVEDELTTSEVTRILGELKAAGTFFLTLTGGEIFTRRDILVLVRRARELGFALRLFSNGTLIDEARADEIAAIGVLAVELSLYSMDPALHDDVTRIPGSLARTLRAARLLRERGVTVVVKSPIMAGLEHEYRRVIAFADEIGAQYKFDPTLVARNDLDEAPLQHRLSSADFYDLCKDPQLGLAVEPGSVAPHGPGAANCSTGRRVALISARGLVYPCSQRFPPAGNLRHRSFREIWETSPLLLRLRNITAQDLPTCSGCSNNAFCGRCYLDAKQQDGDFWGPSSWAQGMAEARLKAFADGGKTMREMIRERFGDQTPGCEL